MQKQLLMVKGLRIALISCAPRDEKALLLQFQRLGIHGDSFSDYAPAIFDVPYDCMVFDSDNRDLIHVNAHNTWPALPKIALMGMETPSRITWVIERGVNAFLRKPVKAEGILSTLVLARHHFRSQEKLNEQLEQHQQRHQLRRFLLSAQMLLIREFDYSENDSYALLRRLATNQQKSVEEFCVTFLSNPDKWRRYIKSL